MNWFKSSNDPKAPVCIRERTAYSFGNVALGIHVVLIMYLLNFFYTTYVGLDPGIVGTIMFVGSLIDAVSDVVMGILVDKTRSRWGKARPWVLFSAPLYAICMVAVFAVPMDATLRLKYIWVAITYYLISSVFFTISFTSLLAMNSLITSDPKEQGILGAFFQALAYIAILGLNAFTLKAVTALGNDVAAWTKVVIVYAIIMLVLFVLCFFGTKERVTTESTGNKAEYGVLEGLKILFKDKYWVKYSLAYFANSFAGGFNNYALVYFTAFVIGNSEKYATLSNATTIAMVLALTVGASFIVKRLGASCRMAAILMIAGCIIQLVGINVWTIVLVGAFVRGLSQGVFVTSQGGLMAATATHVRQQSNVDVTGLSMSSAVFGAKVGQGMTNAIAGWLLNFAGFDGALAVQPASANKMITIIYVVLPMAFSLLMFLILRNFNLEEDLKKANVITEAS